VTLVGSKYHPRRGILRSGHWSTIIPALTSKNSIEYSRVSKIPLSDGELVVAKWLDIPSDKLLVLLPGIEGESDRHYMTKTATAAVNAGWSTLLLNLRGCGGGTVTQAKTYHGGAIDDLHDVLTWINKYQSQYSEIALCGFSLGGNIILNYLGNDRYLKSPKIVASISYSVPCDFTTAGRLMAQGLNLRIYGNRFTKSLSKKMLVNRAVYEKKIDLSRIENCSSLWDFDDKFTAPINGYKNVEDYYHRVSSLQFLHNINVPSLLINANNDPMLSDECYPERLAKKSSFFHLEIPQFGGHVGFAEDLSFKSFYYERRTPEWLEECSNKKSSWTDSN